MFGPGHAQRRRVADGTRTRDHRDHNPGLYQLSYRHRAPDKCIGAVREFRKA